VVPPLVPLSQTAGPDTARVTADSAATTATILLPTFVMVIVII